MDDNRKLYVIVRGDLESPSYQAVQAGHAVAEYLLTVDTSWDNEILIYLSVKNMYTLMRLMRKFDRLGLEYITFREPDLNNELTALAVEGDEKYFKNFQLL